MYVDKKWEGCLALVWPTRERKVSKSLYAQWQRFSTSKKEYYCILKHIRLQPNTLCQKKMAQRTTIVVVFILHTKPVLDISW